VKKSGAALLNQAKQETKVSKLWEASTPKPFGIRSLSPRVGEAREAWQRFSRAKRALECGGSTPLSTIDD
jgi:hypothetical protein